MSETTANPIIALHDAFEAQAEEQEDKESSQESGKVVESKPEASRTDPGTDPSRTKDGAPEPPKENAPPAEEGVSGLPKEDVTVATALSLDDLKANEKLWPSVQSAVDTEVARQLRGRTAALKSSIREEVIAEYELAKAKEHFDGLSKEDLAAELAENPEAVELYSKVKAAPPPLSQDVQAEIDRITESLKTYVDKMKELPDDVRQSLNPETHLVPDDKRTPQEIMAEWTSKVDDAIIEARVAKELDKNGLKKKSDEEQEAAERDGRAVDPIPSSGRRQEPPPEIGARRNGTSLLGEAFARQGVRR